MHEKVDMHCLSDKDGSSSHRIQRMGSGERFHAESGAAPFYGRFQSAEVVL